MLQFAACSQDIHNILDLVKTFAQFAIHYWIVMKKLLNIFQINLLLSILVL